MADAKESIMQSWTAFAQEGAATHRPLGTAQTTRSARSAGTEEEKVDEVKSGFQKLLHSKGWLISVDLLIVTNTVILCILGDMNKTWSTDATLAGTHETIQQRLDQQVKTLKSQFPSELFIWFENAISIGECLAAALVARPHS